MTLAERGEGGGGKRLSPEVRREPLSQAITAIPYDIVASFVGRPTLLTKDQVRSGPYVVAMRDGHIIGAVGNEVYARGLTNATVDSRYSIIHVEEKMVDPDTNDLLGYTGIYVGSGPLATTGDPAKLLLTDTAREALQGDKLFPESVDVNLDFVPHSPTTSVDAAVIAVQSHDPPRAVQRRRAESRHRGWPRSRHRTGGVSERGRRTRHVLKRRSCCFQADVQHRRSESSAAPKSEWASSWCSRRIDRMSYGLVMESSHEIRQGDRARNP